jgi:predicted amidophosphoribosyltransferase
LPERLSLGSHTNHRCGVPLYDALLDVADLVLGRACLGCGVVGRDLCPQCLTCCRNAPLRRPIPTTSHAAWVAAPYAGLVRTALLAYKDGQRSLARPLGVLLADSVTAALVDAGQEAGFLVRVPGHRQPARGFDALGLVVRHAAIELRRRGLVVPPIGLLRRRHDHVPSKALDRPGRFAALAGAFEAVPSRSDIGLPSHLPLIVVDDVLTTGATLAEALRAMDAQQMPAGAVAVIAAARQRAGRQPGYAGEEPRTLSTHVPPADS